MRCMHSAKNSGLLVAWCKLCLPASLCVTQRGVAEALSRNKWLKDAVGRELGFPSYLTDDSVEAEVVLLDPIPLLRDSDGHISNAPQTGVDSEEDNTLVPHVPWPAVGYVVDLYMPAYRLVVEADGPLHWCRGTDEQINHALGRTALKHRLLRDAGYLLVSVPTYWNTEQQLDADSDDSYVRIRTDGTSAVNRSPTVATAWTGDADAWKSEDLAGASSRNWPQQPSEDLGERMLEFILAAAEETHGLGEQRWDAAKKRREIDFLSGGTGGAERNQASESPVTRTTIAQRWRQQQHSSSVKEVDGSIFLSRRKRKQKPKVTAKPSSEASSKTSERGQRQRSQSEHRTTNNKRNKNKRRDGDPERLAAVRKLKERQRRRGGPSSTKWQSREKNEKQQQSRSTTFADGNDRATKGSTMDQALPVAKLPLDPHDVLGLAPGVTRREVKRAFRALSLRYHPDRNREPGAAARFAELSRAAEQLLQLKQPLHSEKTTAGAKKRHQ